MDKDLLTIPDFLRNQENLAAEKKQQAETSQDDGQSRSTVGLERMTFEVHKEETAADCEAVAALLIELANNVRKGNLRTFEEFWVEGGTEEGDVKIKRIREMLVLRFYSREDSVRSNDQDHLMTDSEAGGQSGASWG